jgi:arylsulfatase A-like enzyme
MAVYYAMISWVDEMIGRLLAELQAQGLEQDTIVVFTTDHGDFCFEHNLAKKDLVLLDSLLHVPLLVRWPGRIAPRDLRDTLAEQVDVMPTLLDLMGIETPFGVQGESFAPCLRGERAAHKDAVFAEVCPPWLYNRFTDYDAFEAHHGSWEKTPFNVPGDFTKSIREKEYRYVWYGTGEEELYDHRTDPHELHNVAGDAAHAGQKTRLKLRLLEWLALSEDPLDPLSIRQLQSRYGAWKGATISPGAMAGPGWLDERFTPNPRRP